MKSFVKCDLLSRFVKTVLACVVGLIEVASQQQSPRISDIQMIHAQQVAVTKLKTLNSTRGSSRFCNFPSYTEEEIQGELNIKLLMKKR